MPSYGPLPSVAAAASDDEDDDDDPNDGTYAPAGESSPSSSSEDSCMGEQDSNGSWDPADDLDALDKLIDEKGPLAAAQPPPEPECWEDGNRGKRRRTRSEKMATGEAKREVEVDAAMTGEAEAQSDDSDVEIRTHRHVLRTRTRRSRDGLQVVAPAVPTTANMSPLLPNYNNDTAAPAPDAPPAQQHNDDEGYDDKSPTYGVHRAQVPAEGVPPLDFDFGPPPATSDPNAYDGSTPLDFDSPAVNDYYNAVMAPSTPPPLDIATCHPNEAHAALMALSPIRIAVKRKLSDGDNNDEEEEQEEEEEEEEEDDDDPYAPQRIHYPQPAEPEPDYITAAASTQAHSGPYYTHVPDDNDDDLGGEAFSPDYSDTPLDSAPNSPLQFSRDSPPFVPSPPPQPEMELDPNLQYFEGDELEEDWRSLGEFAEHERLEAARDREAAEEAAAEEAAARHRGVVERLAEEAAAAAFQRTLDPALRAPSASAPMRRPEGWGGVEEEEEGRGERWSEPGTPLPGVEESEETELGPREEVSDSTSEPTVTKSGAGVSSRGNDDDDAMDVDGASPPPQPQQPQQPQTQGEPRPRVRGKRSGAAGAAYNRARAVIYAKKKEEKAQAEKTEQQRQQEAERVRRETARRTKREAYELWLAEMRAKGFYGPGGGMPPPPPSGGSDGDGEGGGGWPLEGDAGPVWGWYEKR